MKTSDKILLTLFIGILLIITGSILIMNKKIKFFEISGNSVSVEQQRTLPVFNQIDVKGNIKVNYYQDTFQRVIVKTDSNLFNLVITDVSDGKLFLHIKKWIASKQPIEVDVTTDSINDVMLMAGSSFNIMHEIKVHQFDGKAEGGAKFDIEGNFVDLDLGLSAGSIGNFSGHCKNMIINCKAGSVFNADDLIAEKGNISSSAGSIININVTGELSVHASSGSIVKCKGNPQMKSVDISSGAQFIK
jgi:hypothetical protein